MSDNKQKQSNKTGALEMVLMRNVFYRDNYHTAVVALLLLLVINIALMGTVIYRVVHPPKPQYFATTADGRMINWHPLSDPVVTDDFVTQWATNAVRKAFSLDYLHWRQQLQNASGNFTPAGWKYFLTSLKQSNNLKTLTNLDMVSNVEITGAPQILRKELLSSGVYAWEIQMPILVTYSNLERSIPQPMEVTLIVVRVSVKQNPDRIAINDFLPVVKKTAEQQLITSGM